MTAPAGCILALDQGTTSSRAILFGHEGEMLATAQREFPQHVRTGPAGSSVVPAGSSVVPAGSCVVPAGSCAGAEAGGDQGIVEHDPEDIWSSQLECARQVLATVGVGPERVAAIGITNQRETTILWEKETGRPVAQAVVWQSRVSAPICARLRAAGVEDEVRRRTGLLLDPYFSATKIMHLLETIPGLRERCLRGEILFGTVDTFLIWRLTGGRVHATDVTNASRTLLFDIHEMAWSEELCRIFAVPPQILPEVRPSSGVFGATEPGLLGGTTTIPIAGCAGDQQAAAFGQGVVETGAAKNTYGTGAFLLFSTGRQPVVSRHGLLTTPLCAVDGAPHYGLEGSVFIAGALVQWLRDGLGIIGQARDVESLAASVPDSGGVVLVPALTGLGTPHWDPHARGAILGLSRATTKAHIARAALEAIALSVADVAACMAKDAGVPLARLRVDGGAAANDLLLQIQADVLGIPVDRPAVLETTALGAALLAGLATGFFADGGAVAAARRVSRTFEPRRDPADRARLREAWEAGVSRSKAWARG